MDQFETPMPSVTEKKKGKNNLWTSDMDKVLIEGLVQKANEGLKCDKGFKETAYVQVASMISSQFNIHVMKENVINRMKTIKQKFRLIEDMLSQSGFAWNSSTKTVECSDIVWETYVAGHPKVKSLRHKPILMMEELKIICGNDAATGQWCSGGPDINARRQASINLEDISPNQNESMVFDEFTGEDYCDTQMPERSTASENTQGPTVTSNATSTHPQRRQHGKRARASEAYMDTMSEVAKSMNGVAEAIKKKTAIEERRVVAEERRADVDPSELFEALRNIEDMNDDVLQYTFERLIANKVKAKTFITYPPEMRKGFLIREFQPRE